MEQKPIYNLFIGRWQPLHAGHEKLMRTVLGEGKKVCVGFRDTAVDESNPYSIEERMAMFKQRFGPELESGDMILFVLPDIEAVCYGRGVGYQIREIVLDDATHQISATKIRAGEIENI